METIKSIDECFSLIQNGANIKQGIVNGGYPITRIETISNDKFNRDKVGFAGIYEIDKYENYVLEDEDLLMSHINSPQYLGRTVLYEKQPNEIIIHGMNLLRLKANRNIINPRYARYIFYSRQFRRQIVKISKKSVNQASFAVTDLKKIKIKLPSIEKQKCIVEILDLVNNTIEKFKNELGLLDELIKARFVEMFGDIHNSKLYPYVNIDSITTVLSGGTPDRKVEEYWDNGSIRWVKTTELQNCVITDTEERITQAGMDNSSAKIVPIGSVLIAMYGQGKTRGMTGYLAVECTTNQACACILPTKKINQIFLWKYMILSYDKLRNMAKGGNQPNLNIGLIKKFPILFPPIELQNEFADFVRQIDKSKFEIQKSLEKTQELYDSLMQKYFG